MPLKKLFLTGRSAAATPQLDAAEAGRILDDGRGWTNRDRDSFYRSLSREELLERLGSWSPVVRERAAIALARLDPPPVEALIPKLGAPDLETRLGAWQALAQLKGKASPAVPQLRQALEAEELWLRVKAADALAAIGPAARDVAPQLLEMLAREPGSAARHTERAFSPQHHNPTPVEWIPPTSFITTSIPRT